MEIPTEHIKNKVEGGTHRMSKKKEALQTLRSFEINQSCLPLAPSKPQRVA